ncbi:MAG TPA: acyl carrier protein [Candidatus Anaerobutyricum avicola]|nr:acyl carrier protein [Candidatus Anaerobutyricum avicola]
MFEKIRDLIVEEVGVDEEQVTMDASFKNDLNIDSLDLFEMVMTLEEEFDVEIPSEDLENIDTVGDLINYIEEHQN